MSHLARSAAVGLAICSFATASFGQSFVNGGFETGDLTGWTVTPTSNGTTSVQSVEMYDIDGSGPLGTSNAGHFGVGQANFIPDDQEGISLTQSLNLTAGVQYTFSYNWAAYRASAIDNVEGGVFNFIVDGAVINTQAAGYLTGTTPVFGAFSGNYTPTTTGSHSVGVLITRPFVPPGDLFQDVDNFSVSAVPEPMSMLVLGAGSALVALRRRRR